MPRAAYAVCFSYFFKEAAAPVCQYYPIMTADNENGRKASVAKFSEEAKNFAGVYLDGEVDDKLAGEQLVSLRQLTEGEVVVTHHEGFGELLYLLSLDVDLVDIEFPSEFASRNEMILIKMVPADLEVANYFGFVEAYHEPRKTATITGDEVGALAEVQRKSAAAATLPAEMRRRPFRTINLKSKALADNHEGATCLTAILKHVSNNILATRTHSISPCRNLTKDYSFGVLHHMAVCNEPNVLHVLEWHNWTLVGLLFKLAAHVKRSKGGRVYQEYLAWIALVNSVPSATEA